MRYVRLGALVVVVALLAFGCSTDKPTESPVTPSSIAPALNTSLLALPCTEALCDFGPQPPATGIVANGIGLRGSLSLQPGTFTLNVPGTVVKAYAYWEGAMTTTGGGDDQIMINANGGGATPVNGTFIGGDTEIVPQFYTYSYRADVTAMVNSNALNSFDVSGLDFNARCDRIPQDCRNDGVAIVCLYDDGVSTYKEIGLKEGSDFAFYNFAPPLDATVPQVYSFTPDVVARTATLFVIAGSVEDNRPNVIECTPDVGPVQRFVDPLSSNDGPDWDVIELTVDIPANASTLTVELISEKDATSVKTGIPASMVWVFGGLCVTPPEEQGGEGCTPGYWKNHMGSWAATGYAITDDFDTVFGVDYFDPNINLCEALNLKGGGVNALARHAVAALLSMASPDGEYGLTAEQILDAVENHDKDILEYNNQMYCPLGGPETIGKCLDALAASSAESKNGKGR